MSEGGSARVKRERYIEGERERERERERVRAKSERERERERVCVSEGGSMSDRVSER